MKRIVLALALALGFTGGALAGDGVGVGISGSNSGASAGAQSIITFNTPGATSQRLSGTTRVIAAPSVFAPGLASASIETCLGSASGGVAFPGGGFSFGSTVQDSPCQARLNARTLWAFGQKDAAMQALCLDGGLATALQASGYACRVGPNVVAAAQQPYRNTVAMAMTPEAVARVESEQYDYYTDHKTGRDRPCASYNSKRQRCLQWAD